MNMLLAVPQLPVSFQEWPNRSTGVIHLFRRQAPLINNTVLLTQINSHEQPSCHGWVAYTLILSKEQQTFLSPIGIFIMS